MYIERGAVNITAAFDELQKIADADPDQVAEARKRRDLFRAALTTDEDILEVIPSGSLARGTQRDPINDLDLIVVFDGDAHPDWATPGPSAQDALSHTAGRVHMLLGTTEGTFEQLVRLARPKNHAVKCFLDDPEDPDGFTVDAMPALRQPGGHLRVPEAASECWIATNPEHLIERVATRQQEWGEFRGLVRILKAWRDVQDTGLKSLTTEVLALTHLPEDSTRARALYRFFTAAELAIGSPIEDPAGLCGVIQPDLDVERARTLIAAAAKASWAGIAAQEEGDTDRAACQWRTIFGDAFPEPEGGCSNPDGRSKARSAIGAGLAVGVSRPRPVVDAPQGVAWRTH